METVVTQDKFEYIIEKLNIIKPTFTNWGCGDEFGGYGQEREIDCLDGTLIPLIYDRSVFGFCYRGVVYYKTSNLNALRLAKTYASLVYSKMCEIK